MYTKTIQFNLYKYFRYLVTRKLYYAIARSYPVWYFWVNREGRKFLKKSKVELGSEEKKIVSELRQKGIAVSHLDNLFGPDGKRWLESFLNFTNKLKSQGSFGGKADKPFLTYLLGTTPIIDLETPPAKFSLSGVIFNTVNSYIGVASKLHELDLNITHVISPEEARAGSQRWHRDPEDKRMCKVFLYLTDVDETSGPFNYVLGSQYGGKWRRLFPQNPPAGNYPPDGAVDKIVPKEDARAFTGKAGTVIFCDTSGLHRGGYATGRERIMLTAGFVTKGCVSGPKFRYALKP